MAAPSRRYQAYDHNLSGVLLAMARMRQDPVHHLFGALLDDAPLVGVAFEQGAHIETGLLEGNMRRQRWNIWVGLEFDHHRAISIESLLPAGTDILGFFHPNAFEAQHFTIAGIGKVLDI